MENFVQPAKKKLNELRSSKKSATLPAEKQKGQTFNSQSPKPGSQLPAPMLDGELLMDDASIRDFNGGIGRHVVLTLEQTLLLPKDMVELQGFRKSEVFLHTKRFLGIVHANSSSLLLLFFLFLNS